MLYKEATLTKYSHYVCLTNIQPRIRQAIDQFARRYVAYGFERRQGRNVQVPTKVFAASTADRSEYRFHINQLRPLMEHLKRYGFEESILDIVEVPPPAAYPVDFVLQEKWTDRPHQPPVINYMVDPLPNTRKLVSLQTGKGKSYCVMRAMQILKMRTVIFVRPMYIEKWIEDIERTYHIDRKDIAVVQGGAQLRQLLHLGATGQMGTIKIIIISNKTMQLWIKEYESLKEGILDLGYDCTPANLCETIGVGMRVMDEVHQDFHLNFKIDLYTNVQRASSLSATLFNDDDFTTSMYQLAYPSNERCEEQELDKYVHAKGIVYRFNRPEKIRHINPATKHYSHIVFEQSLMKYDHTCNEYFDLIKHCLDSEYIKFRKEGDKAIVYCASIDMCTAVTSYLSMKFVDLNVVRYVDKDLYASLADADIIVSTILSAGTAVDIPRLISVVLTTNVNSIQSNVQTLGRLRKLNDDDRLTFLYFTCEDFPKHLEYHMKKQQMLQHRAATYNVIRIGSPL